MIHIEIYMISYWSIKNQMHCKMTAPSVLLRFLRSEGAMASSKQRSAPATTATSSPSRTNPSETWRLCMVVAHQRANMSMISAKFSMIYLDFPHENVALCLLCGFPVWNLRASSILVHMKLNAISIRKFWMNLGVCWSTLDQVWGSWKDVPWQVLVFRRKK